jgi:hypothetical protein
MLVEQAEQLTDRGAGEDIKVFLAMPDDVSNQSQVGNVKMGFHPNS